MSVVSCDCIIIFIMVNGIMPGFLLAAPVTSLGDTPLAVAICHERLDIVKYLVTECKVRVNGE